jgi:hypothetical protein
VIMSLLVIGEAAAKIMDADPCVRSRSSPGAVEKYAGDAKSDGPRLLRDELRARLGNGRGGNPDIDYPAVEYPGDQAI